jgi:signal transduction histidine kinase
VRRVFENLVDNALRFTPRDGEIALVAEPGAREVRVCNTGRPIEAALRAKLFEKYGRGEDSPASSNLGLGLYFCRRVLEAHGASIDLSADERWPTQFVVRFGEPQLRAS